MVLGNHLQPFIITYHKKTLPIKTLPMNSWVKSEFVVSLNFTSQMSNWRAKIYIL